MISLCDRYEDYFPIGAAVDTKVIRSHEEILARHFNSITPDNDLKCALIHPEENRYAFANADQLVEFAGRNRMKVRGHTLVWHNQTPAWIFLDRDGRPVGRDTLLGRMEEHISTVAGRYHRRIYCWDVVNEAIADAPADFLRPTKWLEIIGEDYLQRAFEYAHRADPEALLFYNDYNACEPAKSEKIYRLVKGLKDKGTPIHGLGLQGHWNIFTPTVDEIRRALEKYASLGLQLQITELDVSVFRFEDHRTDLTAPTAEMLDRQARFLGDAFAVLREYKDVVTGVSFWGVADDRTWLDDFPVKNRKNWPLLFDVDHGPKEAFWRITDFA